VRLTNPWGTVGEPISPLTKPRFPQGALHASGPSEGSWVRRHFGTSKFANSIPWFSETGGARCWKSRGFGTLLLPLTINSMIQADFEAALLFWCPDDLGVLGKMGGWGGEQDRCVPQPFEDYDLARQEGVTSGEREETTVTLDSLPNQKIGSNAVRGWEPRSGQIDAPVGYEPMSRLIWEIPVTYLAPSKANLSRPKSVKRRSILLRRGKAGGIERSWPTCIASATSLRSIWSF
jgi:hypothetical protein